MENVIKKIFSGNPDEDVHSEFVKFSKGEFKDRYLIEAKKQKDKWSIKTSHEFANFFVKRVLDKTSKDIKISGAIVSTSDIKEECEFEIDRVKHFMGIKQLIVNCSTEPGKVLKVMENHPRVFYALSLKTDDAELKIKAKAPKSAKPSTKGGGGPKADFCSLKTSDPEIIKDLFFDYPDFKEIKIKHTIKINEIVMPSGVEDPAKIRELAKRKGVIVREVEVDGKEKKSEKEFEV